MRRIAPLLLLFSTLSPSETHACGCFTPPDPTVPVVQAGERILFARSGNDVIAYVQIQYAGDAQDFGWLVPLPSLPTLDLGTDELFTKLSEATQPTYAMDWIYPQDECRMPPGPDLGFGYYASDLGGAAADMGMAGPPSPLVVEDSIGPYDYAVLKADDKTAMLGWLTANHYFVPTGTDDVVAPYLHPGAYFLALKLKSGKSAGDLQPVVLRYASDLPMIPIALTSTGAQAHMGIAVWLLGDARAIPRNYYHVVLDDAALDWFSGGGNYRDLLVRAVAEAPGRHAFVTEFAGASAPFGRLLDWQGRFGDETAMRRIGDATTYVEYLADHGYYFGGALITILQKYFPMPDNVFPPANPATYYYNLRIYTQRGQGLPQGLVFDAGALTDEIDQRVVQPARAAAALFSTYPYLTRLFTTLSPEDMNRDPVFDWNPFLPDVAVDHRARLELRCATSQPYGYDATLHTEQGLAVDFPGAVSQSPPAGLPAALRIEILRESGLPEVVTDNSASIAQALAIANSPTGNAHGACSVQPAHGEGGAWALGALAVVSALLALARRRRSRRRRDDRSVPARW